MQANMSNYSKMRILYLQTPTHETLISNYINDITVYTSGSTIASVLHLKNYDCLILDMNHVESMEVLENIKNFIPERYVIACSSEPDVIVKSLSYGADAIILDPLNEKECERALYKSASYLNMREIFDDTYYIDKLTSYSNIHALEEKICFIKALFTQF
jgi:DNA-binding NarL/FixJ family response regulator